MRETVLGVCLGVLVVACAPAWATSYNIPVPVTLDSGQLGTYAGVPGNEYWLWGSYFLGEPGYVGLWAGDEVTMSFTFTGGEMLRLFDPTNLAMESVHWAVRSALSKTYNVDLRVTLSGPGGSLPAFTQSGVPSGGLNTAGYDWVQEYLNPVGGVYFVNQIDAYFKVNSVQSASQMQFESWSIGLDARDVAIVPEPGCAGLVLVGLAGLVARRR